MDENQVRVLGCLVEKAATTPDSYPLTLNALVNACNQRSKRSPVVNFDPRTVVRALDGLRERRLVWEATGVGSRSPKYRHDFADIFGLDEPEAAALCVLMLLGPQTQGEIRTRCSRHYAFPSLAAVEQVLQALQERETPLVIRLPRRTGHKEFRYAHTLAGEPNIDAEEAPAPMEPATLAVREEQDSLRSLEESVDSLKNELASLRKDFDAFKKQFE